MIRVPSPARKRREADTDYAFAHPTNAAAWDADEFRLELDAALAKAGIADRVRLHDCGTPH